MVSVARLIDDGYHFIFKREMLMIVAPDGKYINIKAGPDNMFYITIRRNREMSIRREAELQLDHKLTSNPEVNLYENKAVNINDLYDKFEHIGETLLRKTMKHLGCDVRGTLKSYDACRMAKARAKGVKKMKETKSECGHHWTF